MKTPAKPEGLQQQIQQQTMAHAVALKVALNLAEDSVVCVAFGLEKLETITLIRKATIWEIGQACQ